MIAPGPIDLSPEVTRQLRDLFLHIAFLLACGLSVVGAMGGLIHFIRRRR